MNSSGKPAIAKLYEAIYGYQVPQVLYVLAKYGIADHLKEGPKSGDELAALAKLDAPLTNRVLRAAASFELLAYDTASRTYQLNDVSQFIVDGPHSMRYLVLQGCHETSARPFCNLDKILENKVNGFRESYGVSYYEYLEKDPELHYRFNRACSSNTVTNSHAKALSDVYGFNEVKYIVDLGGGPGAFVAEILRLNPHLKGTNFDLPNVIEEAKQLKGIDMTGIESRFEHASGSLFETAPPGADVYMLKCVIHNWDDENALKMLKTIRNVMPDHGKVIIIDLLYEGNIRDCVMDLTMMVLLSAKERSEEDFRKLLDEAGLKLTRTLFIPGVQLNHVIEAEKKKL